MTTEILKAIPTKELADCLGTTIGFASQIKTGHRKLPIKYCADVSARFGIPIKELRKDISKYFDETPNQKRLGSK